MAAEGVAAAVAQRELWALRVRFDEGSTTWRVGCAAHPGPLAAGWSAAHDAGLLTALRELSALGGLPKGAAKKSVEAWGAAEAALRSVHSALHAAGGAKLDAGLASHKCAPGYETSGCKQVRHCSRACIFARSRTRRCERRLA